MKKLKLRWGVQSNKQLIIIFIVFSITGSASIFLTSPILKFIHITKENLNIIVYYFLKIIIVFPIYQLLLVLFGFILGQFEFFWNFEKKMLRRLGLGFLLK